MHVALIITRAGIGGAQRHVSDLVKRIPTSWKISVIYGGSDNDENSWLRHELESWVIANGRSVFFYRQEALKRPISPVADFIATINLRRLLREIKPDVVHLHSTKAGMVGRLALLGLRPACVYTLHGDSFSRAYPRLRRFLIFIIEKTLHHRTDWSIFLSHDACDRFMSTIGKNGSYYSVIPNGVQDNRPSDLTLFRPHGRFKIVCISRLAHPKNVSGVLDWFSELVKFGIKASLVVFGDGPDRNILENKAASLGVADQVIWQGTRVIKPSDFAEAGCLVLFSYSEGTPLSVLEAMSAGLLVVTSKVGNLPSVIKDGVNGLLVPVGDEVKSAQKVAAILRNSDLLNEMGEAARDTWEQYYDVEYMAQQTITVYREVIVR